MKIIFVILGGIFLLIIFFLLSKGSSFGIPPKINQLKQEDKTQNKNQNSIPLEKPPFLK